MTIKKNVIQFAKRKNIYDFIAENPGLNKREISRRLSIPVTTLTYHLKYLKKLNLIKEKIDGEYLRIFVSNEIGKDDEQFLCLFRNKNSCKIIVYLLFSLSFSQIELSKELELSAPTVSYHLKKMVDMGIIEEVSARNGIIYPFPTRKDYVLYRKPVKSEKFYRRKNHEIISLACKVLRSHRKSFCDKELIKTYIEYVNCWEKKIPVKKLKSIDDGIDSALEVFLDIFRLPFCS